MQHRSCKLILINSGVNNWCEEYTKQEDGVVLKIAKNVLLQVLGCI